MQITRIKISNFKSFDDAEISLSRFNIIIGANASGKSNFIQALKFIQDCFAINLDSAISIQGGPDAIRNVKLGKGKNTRIELEADIDELWPSPIDLTPDIKRPGKKKRIALKILKATYSVEVEFKQKGNGIKNVNDLLRLDCGFFEFDRVRNKLKTSDRLITNAIITITGNRSKKPSLKLEYPEEEFKSRELPPAKTDYLFPIYLKKFFESKIDKRHLPLTIYVNLLPLSNAFANFSIFDIDPKLAKKGGRLTGVDQLEEDGSNIAPLLRDLFSDKKKEDDFYLYVNELLPQIAQIRTEDAGDKVVLLKVKENYFKQDFFYGPFLSDGTVNIVATVYALYFDNKKFIVLEEPERNLHPHLIRKLVEMMDDASSSKQIIVTTHNPLLLRYSKLDSIILVSRDESGISHVYRPFEKKKLDEFLANEIGVEELMIENTLEKIP